MGMAIGIFLASVPLLRHPGWFREGCKDRRAQIMHTFTNCRLIGSEPDPSLFALSSAWSA